MFTLVKNEIFESLKNKKLIVFVITYFIIMFFLIKLGSFLEIFARLYLGSQMPFSLVVPYYSMIISMSILILLLSYESIAKEKENKTIRQLLTIVKRRSFVLSKIIDAFMITAGISFITIIGIFIYTYNRLKVFYPEIFMLWLISLMFSIALISIFTFISSLTDNSAASLRYCTLAMMLLIYLAIRKSEFSILNYLMIDAGISSLWLLAYPLIFIPSTIFVVSKKDY